MKSLYLQRYAYPKQLIADPPPNNLEMAVIIPCYHEPQLLETLESLHHCTPPSGPVEVIVVINDSDKDHDDVKAQNQNTLVQAQSWVNQVQSPLHYQILYETLPAKHAGVGLARKVGMDEAVRRFNKPGNAGVLICLDADCLVDPNYLIALESHFKQHPKSPGCSIYYEHPLEGPLEPSVYLGILLYELHLRYYTHALRYAGHPFAFQTVGSSMAVRSSAYQKQGGMNKRKAGEDFYFLQDIFLLGNFSELKSTRVIPSPRASNRVPFGTGKAISSWLNNPMPTLDTYNPLIFSDLKRFIYKLPDMISGEIYHLWDQLPSSIQGFIGKERYLEKVSEIRANTRNLKSFQKRFFQWCNGFFAFKYAHYARDHFYPQVEVTEAAAWVLQEHYGIEPKTQPRDLLQQLRKLDKA